MVSTCCKVLPPKLTKGRSGVLSCIGCSLSICLGGKLLKTGLGVGPLNSGLMVGEGGGGGGREVGGAGVLLVCWGVT